MANTGGFILPDFAGAYRSGVEWGQDQAERKRRQPMVEQLEQLTLEKTKQGISLQDFALKEKQRKQQRDDIADISKMAGWVMSQPPEQRVAAWNQAIDFRVSEGDTEAENYRNQWSDQFGDMLANMNPDDVMAAKYTTPLIENVGTMDKPDYRAVQYSQTGERLVHEGSTPLTPYEKSLGRSMGGVVGKSKGTEKVLESGDPFVTAKVEEQQAKTEIQKDKATEASKGKIRAYKGLKNQVGDGLRLIKDIRKHPGFTGAIGAKDWSSGFGAFQNPIAGTDAAGAASLVETLASKNFLTGIKDFKDAGGGGSLSDAEGQKLGAALTNLSTAQSEADFLYALDEVERILERQMRQAEVPEGYQDEDVVSEKDKLMIWLEANPDHPKRKAVIEKAKRQGLM